MSYKWNLLSCQFHLTFNNTCWGQLEVVHRLTFTPFRWWEEITSPDEIVYNLYFRPIETCTVLWCFKLTRRCYMFGVWEKNLWTSLFSSLFLLFVTTSLNKHKQAFRPRSWWTRSLMCAWVTLHVWPKVDDVCLWICLDRNIHCDIDLEKQFQFLFLCVFLCLSIVLLF